MSAIWMQTRTQAADIDQGFKYCCKETIQIDLWIVINGSSEVPKAQVDIFKLLNLSDSQFKNTFNLKIFFFK